MRSQTSKLRYLNNLAATLKFFSHLSKNKSKKLTILSKTKQHFTSLIEDEISTVSQA
jgi:hypothetical protein